MSAVPKRLMTPKEYLAFERASDVRHEYYRGEIFAMAGASFEHTQVKDNLAGELRERFKNGPCKALTSDLRLRVDTTGLYTYPDIIILCGKGEFEDAEVDVLLNPTAVVEVLSESTEKYERGKKFKHYQNVVSIREYVLVAQDEMLIERYVRRPDESWVITTFAGRDAIFSFATIPVSVPFREIYRDVELDPQPSLMPMPRVHGSSPPESPSSERISPPPRPT